MPLKEFDGIDEIRRSTSVVHVSSAHAWSDNRIHLREAASLARHGYRVHLVAIAHDVDLSPTGVAVKQLPRRSRWSRIFLGSFYALKAAVGTGSDIFHLHDPEMVWAIPLLRAAGKRVVYDAHEDLPAQVLGKHYLPHRTRGVVARLSKLVMRVAGMSNRVVTATEAIADTFGSRAVVVHNYPRLDTGREVIPVLDRPTRVVYVGALSEIRGAVEMVDSFADPTFPPGWTVDIAGSTSPPALLTTLKTRPGWERVRFHGQTSPSAAREYIGLARVGLVLFQESPAHLESLPTKMFEYLAEGVPVIASDFPLWRTIVDNFQCGQLVDQTDPKAIATALRKYHEDPGLLALHAKNARSAAVRNLNWTAEEQVLVALYDDLAVR